MLDQSVLDEFHLRVDEYGNVEVKLGCTRKVTALPESLSVVGALNLTWCTSLTALPEGLRVGGNLDLRDCTSLTALPEGLSFGGYLRSDGCTSLTALPEGLSVGGFLSLGGCTSLIALPEGLSVGGYLDLEGCTNITSLPGSIFEWPLMLRRDRQYKHSIYLGGSGISRETLDWIRDQQFDNLRFHVDLSNDGSSTSKSSFISIEDAITFWKKEAGVISEKGVSFQQSNSSSSFQKHQEQSLLFFLSKLKGAKEFGINEQRKPLAKRVVELMGILFDDDQNNTDESTRNQILIRISDSLDACNDKPIWALNQMQLVIELSKARGNRKKLKDWEEES